MPDPNRDYKTVSAQTWRRMLRLAHYQDLQEGGLYDARSGCINVWVSPEDHPPSWNDVEITKGGLLHAREYLGGIMGEHTEDLKRVILTLEVTPYEREPQRHMGTYPTPEEDEWTWIRAKADELLQQAEQLVEPRGDGIFCKFCEGPIKVDLVNDFLKHLEGTHNVKIVCVVMGESTYVETNVGRIDL